MKKKRKTSDLSFLTGSQFLWSSREPLTPGSELINQRVSHTNPIKRILMQKNKGVFLSLIASRRLKWKVTIEVELSGVDREDWPGAEMVVHGILTKSDGKYQDAIREIFEGEKEHMHKYVMCHFTVEILGNDSIQDGDFTIKKEESEEAA